MSVPEINDVASACNRDSAFACRDLDGLLFADADWFAIDEANVRVPGVVPGSLEQALALIGRGRVATIVGRLRPEVSAVDIDASGALGDLAAEAVRDWCTAKGLWHLVRDSGGGPGRRHVLVVPGVHREDLAAHVKQLGGELKLTKGQIALPGHLRPLSAPHRRNGHTDPPGGLAEALTALRAALEPIPAGVIARRATAPLPAPAPKANAFAPLAPLRRPRRALPGPWAAYLEHGRTAAAGVDRDPATRSQLELDATVALIIAGYTEPEAWAAISAAHPSAFTKARSKGRAWWWQVWNAAVPGADDWLDRQRATRPPTPPPPPPPSIGRARAALEAAWRTWPARTRHVDHEIATVVLERMTRVGADAVPIPQRDLVLDAAVAARPTVRGALARLQAAGLLVIEATYLPGTTDTAHTLRLPERFTAAPQQAAAPGSAPPGLRARTEGWGVSLLDPSRSHPPSRRPALPLRRSLGLRASALLAHLPPAEHAAGSSALELAPLAGFTTEEAAPLSVRSTRTVRGHLGTLAGYGLAQVDEHGRWRATAAAEVHAEGAPRAQTGAAAAALRAGEQADRAVREQISAERAEFRARLDPAVRRARWERQRDVALARAAKAALKRQKAWWDTLPDDEREQRRTAHAAAFTALSPTEQARRKHELAVQRVRAGISERARYDTWLTALLADDLAARSIARARDYARLARQDQAQLVEAWCTHRTRWDLPHHRRVRPGGHLAAGPAATGLPEHALLRRPPYGEVEPDPGAATWRQEEVIAVTA